MEQNAKNPPANSVIPQQTADSTDAAPVSPQEKPVEIGGSKRPEPTRYGDWEIGGKCVDF